MRISRIDKHTFKYKMIKTLRKAHQLTKQAEYQYSLWYKKAFKSIFSNN